MVRFATNQRQILSDLIISYGVENLPGVGGACERVTLIEQFIDSLRRIEYVNSIQNRPIDSGRIDPRNPIFDPLRAAVQKKLNDDYEEAVWLVFLATYCGVHIHDKWSLAASLYGRGYSNHDWSWGLVSGNVEVYVEWISRAYLDFNLDGQLRRFGNHRKYETLLPTSARGFGAVVRSYVQWIFSFGSHRALFEAAHTVSQGDPYEAFDFIYHSMSAVKSFGRTGKFDFLTMISKLNLANIEPGKPYLVNATGPLKGARLLFGAPTSSARELDRRVAHLGEHLGLQMQVMEDALCNWQKSPSQYLSFRG